MLLVNILLTLGYQQHALNTFVVIVFSMMFLAIYYNGPRQISWLYPATALIFFTSSPMKALMINTALVAAIGFVIFDKLAISQWIQNIISVQFSIFIVYIFCSKVHQQLKLLEINVQKHRSDALIDKLSGLGNRRSFDIEINQLSKLVESHDGSYFLALLDIDDFKLINDTHGHAIGDEVIVHVSETIKSNSRAYERPFRIGGEEFALIINADDISKALGFGERLRQIVENTPYISCLLYTSPSPRDRG